jgi:hypothetical protein
VTIGVEGMFIVNVHEQDTIIARPIDMYDVPGDLLPVGEETICSSQCFWVTFLALCMVILEILE